MNVHNKKGNDDDGDDDDGDDDDNDDDDNKIIKISCKAQFPK